MITSRMDWRLEIDDGVNERDDPPRDGEVEPIESIRDDAEPVAGVFVRPYMKWPDGRLLIKCGWDGLRYFLGGPRYREIKSIDETLIWSGHPDGNY